MVAVLESDDAGLGNCFACGLMSRGAGAKGSSTRI